MNNHTINQKIFEVNGLRLNVAEAGNSQAPLILFLHGFPEFGYAAWHQQLLYFAQQGYRAVAPDQRGYNLSSKPAGVKAYRLENLTMDIVALIKSLTTEKVMLVGHDWGGAVAWAIASQHPQLLQKLVILNMPHPHIMHQHLRKNTKQMRKSWYAGFFQMKKIPELLCSAFNYKILVRAMSGTARAHTFSPTQLQLYKTAWRQPGALTSMINWYRAYTYSKVSVGLIVVPTLLIWGRNDTFLGTEMAAPSIAQCKEGELTFIPESTHWVHHEKAEEVSNLIYKFIHPGN